MAVLAGINSTQQSCRGKNKKRKKEGGEQLVSEGKGKEGKVVGVYCPDIMLMTSQRSLFYCVTCRMVVVVVVVESLLPSGQR